VTGTDGHAAKEQQAGLNEIKASLATHGIDFIYSFDELLHDRDVQFDNGWLVRLGRGLDYFKKTEGQYVLGCHDYNMRPCYAVNIDVWQDIHS
jgi:hypothetical protein